MSTKRYGKIKLEKDIWVLTELEPHVTIKLKAIFPKIQRTAIAPFKFQNNKDNCMDLYWFMLRYKLLITKEDKEALKKQVCDFYQNQDDMEQILLPDFQPKQYPTKEGQKLRKYQAQAVEIFKRNKVLLIGDEVGLGKTYCGIGAILANDQLPAIIIVQTHLPLQWQRKIQEFSHLKTHLIKGTKPYSLPEADVYIIRYSCLRGWTVLFDQGFFKTAIFDEIQELRHGRKSEKGTAAAILTQHTTYKMGMTATPIYNYGEEIFNIMDILQQNCIGSADEFHREWCYGVNGKVRNPKALGTYLREKYLFIRRTREDVGQELPPINRILEVVDYDQKEVQKSEEIAKQLAIKSLSGSFIERGRAAAELDMFVRKMTGVAKAHYVAEYVKIILENKEPVLLVGWHRDVYEIWNKELAWYKPVMFTGSETTHQKETAKEDFVSGKTDLMIMSLRSGIGLDGLQDRCSIVVFGELDWSPMVHHQVIGRLDREGQKKQVLAIFLYTESGSDPLIIDLLGIKSDQAQKIVDPHLGIQQTYSDESRIKLLAEKYLTKRELEEIEKRNQELKEQRETEKQLSISHVTPGKP